MRTQIVINNTEVDLLKEVSLNITKQLVDIQNPEKRKTDRSLTIEIPGSKSNDLLFSYIFEVNVDLNEDDSTHAIPNFNPNKKAAATIYIDTLSQLKGYCQLTDVVISHENKITYKIVCFGEIGDLFSKIGNAELTDLDFSEFDHEYKRGNIANSWDTEIIENGVGTTFALGKGYIYPMVHYGIPHAPFSSGSVTGEVWSPNEFRPAVYVKQYIDKIFESAGYTYTSNFFNTDFFKRLFVPFNSDKFILDNAEVESRLFYAGRTSTSITNSFYNNNANIASASTIIFNEDSTHPYYDNDSNYNSSTGKYICNKAAKYSFSVLLNAILHYDDFGKKITVRDIPTVYVNIVLIRKSGSTYSIVGSGTTFAFFSSTTILSGDSSSEFKISISAKDIQLNSGDEIFVAPMYTNAVLDPDSSLTTGSLNSGFTLETLASTASKNTFFSNGMSSPNILDGYDLAFNSCIPTEIKQRDFLSSIIKAFNLYMEANPDNETDLIIEPRADYYTGQYTDWTEKLDISNDFTISPMAALDAEEYHFTYKEDDDDLNKDYKIRYGRTYGDHKLKIENDFVRKTKKIELIFAPTPLYKDPTENHDRILSSIQFFDKEGKPSPKTSKIRLLYYGGMKDCQSWFFSSYMFANYQFNQYPYSGHLDDPYDSTLDLNFAPPAEVFYRSTAEKNIFYSNQNLYNKYWFAQMKELTDKNSKLVEGWFYLTPSDIEGISFRKYYFIKDAYYRLLKVENYNPVFSKVTKCQFLKVQEFDAPLQIKAGLNGGSGTFGTSSGTVYKIPTISGTFTPINQPTNGTTIVTGWDNTVEGTSSSVILNGINNNVLSGSTGITVLGGGGNLIYPSLENVTLINSSGIVATESNTLYINNQKYNAYLMGDSATITNSDSPYTLPTTTKTLFCDATEGSITVNLPTAVGNNGKIYEIIKTDASANGITVAADGSETINGLATQGLTAQYDKLQIVSNGTEWFKL